jgi:hypothetical protein
VRTCRYCRKPFVPLKPHYWWCSLACRDASAQRAGGSTYDQGYRDGFTAGYTRGLADSRQSAVLSPELWRQMISLTHPDRYAGTALACAADTCVRWLLEHRPTDERRN